jgi:hypothetical protein
MTEAEIRAELQQRRQQAKQAASSLKRETREAFDWRRQVERHPLMCLGATALVGYLLVPTKSQVIEISDDQVRKLARSGDIKFTAREDSSSVASTAGGMLLTAAAFAARSALAHFVQSKLR